MHTSLAVSQFSGHILQRLHLESDYVTARRLSQFEDSAQKCDSKVTLVPFKDPPTLSFTVLNHPMGYFFLPKNALED